MARFKFNISSLFYIALSLAPFVNGAQVTYNSRPDISTPSFDVLLHNASAATPGYLFITTAIISDTSTQSSPMIYDTLGNLVWSGVEEVGGSYGTDFHPCPLFGDANNLCVYSGAVGAEFWRGKGVIMDSSYRTVKTVHSGKGRAPSDGHEFNVLRDGNTALITIYQPVQYDMSKYNINSSQGWIMDGIAQEIDIESGKVVFEWRALDHVDPASCYVSPGLYGTGTTASDAWQYFHINAVDKDPAGNYLISSRYCSTIYYVSATDGSIIWSLNGIEPHLSNYTLEGFNFSFQHNVRFLHHSHTGNTSSTIISIFDNNSNGIINNSAQSKGIIMQLSSSTIQPAKHSTLIGTASLLAAYRAPLPQGLLSSGQGNLQILPKGNVLVGWGSNAYVSEYLADGTPVYFANFNSDSNGNSYRVYKANFTGNPLSLPAIYSYALNSFVATTHYVSWNGCTQCAAWNFYEGASQLGPFILASTKPIVKTGFETNFTGRAFAAEALDADGKTLGKSQVEKTFVPGKILAVACNDTRCPETSNILFRTVL